MYFPVAGIEVQPALPIVVAFVVSFFSSMGGSPVRSCFSPFS